MLTTPHSARNVHVQWHLTIVVFVGNNSSFSRQWNSHSHLRVFLDAFQCCTMTCWWVDYHCRLINRIYFFRYLESTCVDIYLCSRNEVNFTKSHCVTLGRDDTSFIITNTWYSRRNVRIKYVFVPNDVVKHNVFKNGKNDLICRRCVWCTSYYNSWFITCEI